MSDSNPTNEPRRPSGIAPDAQPKRVEPWTAALGEFGDELQETAPEGVAVTAVEPTSDLAVEETGETGGPPLPEPVSALSPRSDSGVPWKGQNKAYLRSKLVAKGVRSGELAPAEVEAPPAPAEERGESGGPVAPAPLSPDPWHPEPDRKSVV